MKLIRLGTRKSPLALAQAQATKAALLAAGVEQVEIVAMSTSGDEQRGEAIAQWGYKGLFTKEIEEALLDKTIDIAVHSMKDMPSILPQGLMLAGMLPREDVRDGFISKVAPDITSLPQGATLGTASTRRAAQVRSIRPDLKVIEFRGSVETRLRKLSEGTADATLLAVAGLNRLALQEHITQAIPSELMLPAIGQGAVGIECRCDDTITRHVLERINHSDTFTAVCCERIILQQLDGSCKTPMAALAEINGERISLRASVFSTDGTRQLKAASEGSVHAIQSLGEDVAEALLAQGAKELIHG